VREARLRLLKMHFESGVGHIGGNLSSLELLLTLHHRVMRDNDQFILSKGHAAGALYVTLWSLGRLSEEQLATFHKDHTKLGAIPCPTLSLTFPLPSAALAWARSGRGLALGKRLRGQPGRVFCLMSDGEWNEAPTGSR